MGKYRIVALEQFKKGGLEIRIAGPGIPAAGVTYWFARQEEAHSLIENLNLSYFEAKQFIKWRKSMPEPTKLPGRISARVAAAH